ncbi:hypothetical protein N7414_28210 [Pseudomonas sp. GD04087]|uniref:hypothetical protein n=1 Tax=unclassified Pseudomonas TaxID=196821 RepID=UPI0024471B74|nr:MULTISPECIES: hypothetical protein [unclassified Pseudomonas]MDH0293023.1 hypothetical protein [Pseudomonas sp. GD04087]MDH1053106.1 hypothetical protein [Pseudomonas sp. GD03903]MDH2003097.1 hypothetical protein [Pseudomonas sp. GD03691]
MSYGALFIGNSGQVQIDDNYPCYMEVAAGSYDGSSGTVTVSYPVAINSPNPPAVFVRPDGAHILRYMRNLGGPGNWTGWTALLYADGGFSGIVRSGQYKAAALYLPRTGGYGLQVFDASNRLLFDSNRQVLRIISGAQTWSKVGYNGSYQGNWTTDTWGSPYVAGSYVLASHFMAMFSFPPNVAEMGVGFVNGNAKTQMNAFAMRLGLGLPAINNFNWPLVMVN